MSLLTFAAVTGIGNAGTVIDSVPTYVESLVMSFDAPPELLHSTPFSSGSCSSGDRPPQMSRWSAAPIVLLQPAAFAHRIGKLAGGALLDQPVLTSPAEV